MTEAPRRVTGVPDAATATRYLAYVFMVSMPWATVFMDPINPHDGARMFESLAMVLAVGAVVCGPWRPLARWGRWTLLGLVLLGTLSVLAAEKVAYAALEASAFLLLAFVAVVFARTRRETLLRELPVAVACAALMSLLMEMPRLVFFLVDGRVPQASDFGFMYMSHRFLNHAQTLILPLAFMPLLVPVSRWVRFAAWVGVIGGLALLWRTGGRGTLISFGAFALLLPCLMKSRVKQTVRMLAWACLGGVLVYAVCFVLPAVALGLPQDHQGNASLRMSGVNDTARLYLWRVALEDAVRNPWLGIGPMHYAHSPNPYAAHPHNVIVQLAAEWGLPMAGLLIAAMVALLLRGMANLQGAAAGSDTRSMLAVAWLATLVGCIDSLVSGTLVMPVSQMWWVIASGCMLTSAAGKSPVQPSPGASVRWILASTLIAAHLGLSAVTYHRSLLPPDLAAAIPERNNVPRYWINGRF